MVLVYVAVAMLAAIGFATLRERGKTKWAALLAVLALIDCLPARPSLYVVDRPALYDTLRRRPEEGAVLELPFGVQDGFGVTGRFNPDVLWHQTLHQRGIAGGYLGRVPPRIVAGYTASPLFGPLLDLSAGRPPDAALPDSRLALDELHRAGIRFIVVDRGESSPELAAFVRTLGAEKIEEDGRRDLLRVPQ
jgi:hypothetical protein